MFQTDKKKKTMENLTKIPEEFKSDPVRITLIESKHKTATVNILFCSPILIA